MKGNGTPVKKPSSIEKFIYKQKQLLAENPECATGHYNLGVALMKEGKLDEAIEAFEEAIETGSRMFEAFVNLF
jgi:cytochrome c-type biogenesis protein CcmH/NrfG